MTTVGILVDCSGSMSMWNRMDVLRKALFVKANEIVARGTIRLAIWGFSGYDGAAPEHTFWSVLDFGQTPDWDRFFERLVPQNGTMLAPALQQAAAALRQTAAGAPATLILLTDGDVGDAAATRASLQSIAGPDLSLTTAFFNNAAEPYQKEYEHLLIETFGPNLATLKGDDVMGAIAAITRITG